MRRLNASLRVNASDLRRKGSAVALSMSLVVLSMVFPQLGAGATTAPYACSPVLSCISYSNTTGVVDAQEPSGMAPPSATALAGYQQTYVSDFTGSRLPSGWGTYSGSPGGDPGTHWRSSQVVVSQGVLQLNAEFDTSLKEWITGGTSQNDVRNIYGAYFVRSRISAPGATIVELLWPTEATWPPEIDFNETYGPTDQSTATVHFTTANGIDQRTIVIDTTQWHTWGVIWTPKSITYTVDGNVWGTLTVANEIPSTAMHLAIQQQTWCSKGFACPTAPVSDIIDWVAEYRASDRPAPVVGVGSVTKQITLDATLSNSRLNTLINQTALEIVLHHTTSVTLNVASVSPPGTLGPSAAHTVAQVISVLKRDARFYGAKAIRIVVRWAPAVRGPRQLILHVVFV